MILELRVYLFFRCITKGLQEADNYYINKHGPELDDSFDVCRVARKMRMYDDALKCTNEEELCHMIVQNKLNWEHLPTSMLTSKRVWQALLRDMPIEAMIRNLGRMTRIGVFPENSEEEEIALEKIR